jgi:hypothetical protein
MSPGTTSSAGTGASTPSRITRAVGAAILRSAATARSAWRSCTNPSTALARTMSVITTASIGRPRAPSEAHATIDTTTAPSRR